MIFITLGAGMLTHLLHPHKTIVTTVTNKKDKDAANAILSPENNMTQINTMRRTEPCTFFSKTTLIHSFSYLSYKLHLELSPQLRYDNSPAAQFIVISS